MLANNNSILYILSLFFISCSLFLFIGKSLVVGGFTADATRINPFRWIGSTLISLIVSAYGKKRNSLSWDGSIFAVLVGFCLTLANVSFFVSLLVFFISSSKATRFRAHIKRKLEHGYREGGQRNWLQVMCNGGMAMELSILYLVDIGSADLPVDFRNHYRASWIGVAVLGAIACCNGDTWASEFGSVIGSSEPRLITTGKKVPRGTNGAVSPTGLLASLVGGLVIGLAYWAGVIVCSSGLDLSEAPSQWKVIVIGGVGGLLGSIIDSLLGATIQFSGKDGKSGKVVEYYREGVTPISGRQILDNHGVNLLSSILTALILPRLGMLIGL